jgi:hypothetical protein
MISARSDTLSDPERTWENTQLGLEAKAGRGGTTSFKDEDDGATIG